MEAIFHVVLLYYRYLMNAAAQEYPDEVPKMKEDIARMMRWPRLTVQRILERRILELKHYDDVKSDRKYLSAHRAIFPAWKSTGVIFIQVAMGLSMWILL